MYTFMVFYFDQKTNIKKGTMLVKTILNRIHHFKGFVYKSVKIEMDKLVVDVEPRKNSRGRCSKCKQHAPGYDHLSERFFMFVPLWNIPVNLRYRARRVACPYHGVVVEYLPWATGKSPLCNCFRVLLAQWARLLRGCVKSFYLVR